MEIKLDINIHMTSLGAPVIYEGTVNGVPVYYSAEDGEYKIEFGSEPKTTYSQRSRSCYQEFEVVKLVSRWAYRYFGYEKSNRLYVKNEREANDAFIEAWEEKLRKQSNS